MDDLNNMREKLRHFHWIANREFVDEFIVIFFCRDYNQIPVGMLVNAVKRICNLKTIQIFETLTNKFKTNEIQMSSSQEEERDEHRFEKNNME